jgi:hypothetical protein
MLPEPTLRPDAVDHYAALLADDRWPGEMMCLTVVRGLSVEEALARFDGVNTGREVTLAEAGQASATAFPDDLPMVVADDLDGWVVLAEDNGFHGSMPEVLSRLSAGTVAASAFWNVNMLSQVALAHDGEVVDSFDPVVDEPPAEGPMEPFVRGLDFEGPTCESALAFLERVSGVRVPIDWASRPHPASVIGGFQWLDLSSGAGWVTDLAPRVHAASRPQVRAVATLAAVSACETAGVDDPVVLDSLAQDVDSLSVSGRADLRSRLMRHTQEVYQQALRLRWDRCRPSADETDRRNADRSAEYGLVTRAHAMAAAHGRLMDDPVRGLGLAMANACQVDKPGWPALRGRLTQAL